MRAKEVSSTRWVRSLNVNLTIPVAVPAQKRSGCGNGGNLGQHLAAQSLSLDGEPAPVVVREPETLAPKPAPEHTVLLSQVVNHILLLAVDPASQNEQ